MEIYDENSKTFVPFEPMRMFRAGVTKDLVELVQNNNVLFSFNGDIYTISIKKNILIQKIVFKQPLRESVNEDEQRHSSYVFYPYVTKEDVKECNIHQCGVTIGSDKRDTNSLTIEYLPIGCKGISEISNCYSDSYRILLPIDNVTKLYAASALNGWKNKHLVNGRKACISQHDVSIAILFGYTEVESLPHESHLCSTCFEGIIRIPAVRVDYKGLSIRDPFGCVVCNSTIRLAEEEHVRVYEKVEGSYVKLLP